MCTLDATDHVFLFSSNTLSISIVQMNFKANVFIFGYYINQELVALSLFDKYHCLNRSVTHNDPFIGTSSINSVAVLPECRGGPGRGGGPIISLSHIFPLVW